MVAPGSTQFPQGYAPYESIRLCGNTLLGVKVIFRVGPNYPLLVGRGVGEHPQIWLSGPGEMGSWVQVVAANTAVRPIVGLGQRITVLQDATQPLTVVMIGSVVVVKAVRLDDRSVEIANVDFRPMGLNVFGNDSEGLNFAGNRFIGNTMSGLEAAFAVNFGKP